MNKTIFALFSCFTLFHIGYAQNYQSAESAEYDAANQRWLVSNGSNIIADDGQDNRTFFGNSGANFGMEILGNNLYAVAGGGVRVFDLSTEAIIATIPISGAGFLNGMTNDGVSNIYVTDFGNKKIYHLDVSDLDNPVVETIVNNTVTTPNGIVFDGENNRLIFTSWGNNAALKGVDLTTNTVTTIITTSLGNIDGIDEDGAGNYYISSWSPAQISKFDKDFVNPLEVIFTPFISQPADIGYSLITDTLAIPIGSNVVFVGFDSPVNTLDPSLANRTAFSIFPNPISDQSYIEFTLESDNFVNLQIFNAQGKLHRTLLDGKQTSAKHRILFTGHDLAAGVYFVRLQIGNSETTKQVVVIP